MLTSLGVYLLTVPVNLDYVKSCGLATKITLRSKTRMIYCGISFMALEVQLVLTVLILFLSVTFNVTCLTVALTKLQNYASNIGQYILNFFC